MSLDEHFYEGRKIADIWIENDWTKEVFTKTNEKSDTDKVADSIIRKFSDILNTIGFSKEEINWYKSDSANGEGGKFIFTGDNVAFELKELLKIFKKRTVTITSEERDKIIEYLTDILPVLRSEKDAKQAKKMAKSLIETEKTRRFSEPTSLMSHDFSHLREKLNNNTPKNRGNCKRLLRQGYTYPNGRPVRKQNFCKGFQKKYTKKNIYENHVRISICPGKAMETEI